MSYISLSNNTEQLFLSLSGICHHLGYIQLHFYNYRQVSRLFICINGYSYQVRGLWMGGNASDLCDPSVNDLGNQNSTRFESVILHNRRQAKHMPPLPQPIKDKINSLLASTCVQQLHLNSKIWQVSKPYPFYYINQSTNRDCVPCGLCTMYLYNSKQEFVTFYRGNVSNFGLRETRRALYVYGNGDYFVGDGDRGDYGVYTGGQGQEYRYEGDWVNGRAHGVGKEITKQGVYEGYFLHGKKHGQGKFVDMDGCVFQGQFSHNEMQGKGKITDQKKNYEFTGNFKSGLKQGKGTQKTGQYQYQGNFTNNIKAGLGHIKYKQQKIQYEGQFQNGVPNGLGVMKDGSKRVEGIWSQGKLIALYPVQK